jgi:hypothetical protein
MAVRSNLARDDVDDDALRQIIRSIMQLSPRDMKRFRALLDEEGDGGGYDGPAMDSAGAVGKLQEIRRAVVEVSSVVDVGNDMAFDSAEGVYAAALHRMGVSTAGIDPSGWKPIFQAHRQRQRRGDGPALATDAAVTEGTATSLAERFPHAASIGRGGFGR